MSNDQTESPDRPMKKQRKKRAPTGRPRGRPPKRDELLVLSELRRTLLEILAEEVNVPTPTGVRTVSKFRAVLENTVASAAKGKPTALNHLMRLLPSVLKEREEAHPQVRIAEFLRAQSESPDPMTPVSYRDVRVQINYAKGKY